MCFGKVAISCARLAVRFTPEAARAAMVPIATVALTPKPVDCAPAYAGPWLTGAELLTLVTGATKAATSILTERTYMDTQNVPWSG
mmetsp:Transcript_3306/g.3806  ORF Transcript_3306/g.3806 Transcript_3306/m.3806 type:complete len:86 (-) Transcript_3306:35-292(-)